MLGRQLTICDPAVCDPEIPALPVAYTEMTASVTCRTVMNVDGLLTLSARIEGINYGCVSHTEVYYSQFFSPTPGTLELKSIVTDSTSTTTGTWTYSSESIVTLSSGAYARPTNGVVLATNIAGKCREYTFSSPSFSGNYTVPGDEIEPGPNITPAFNCCDPITPPIDVSNWVPLGEASKTLSTFTPTLKIRYVGVCTTRVSGINLSLRAAGVSLGPWTVSVAEGSITFRTGSGTVTTYTGSLTSVRTSINAAGYFTATIPSNVSTDGGVTRATTADLRPYVSYPMNVTGCVTSAVLVEVGDLLTPSSFSCGIIGNNHGIGTSGFPFRTSYGFPDNQSGLDAFLSSTWYPKSSLFNNGSSGPGYYYITNEFDSWVTNPGNVLVYDSNPWSLTPGDSVQTSILNVPASSGYSEKYTRIVFCTSSPEGCFGALENSPVPIEYCNGSFSACADCSGSPGLTCPDPIGIPAVCCCEHVDSETFNYPERNVLITQTLSGSFALS